MAEEQVLQSGMLSRQATYRVLVRGPVGSRELDVLIRMLTLTRDMWAEDEAAEGAGDDKLPVAAPDA